MKGSKYIAGVFCLAFILFVQTGYSAARKLTVNMVTGDVTYKRGNAKAKPVRKATRLKSKDVIRTLVESSLEIKLDDGSVLTIEENSVVDLSKLVINGKVTNSKINIKTGKVLFNIKKLASKRSDFVFETPTATAAIRGTQGGLGTDGKESYFYLEEGALEITPKGGGASTMIKGLNVAVQTPAGMKVETVANVTALNAAVNKVEAQVLDTTGTGTVPATADTTKVDTTSKDTSGVDTTSQAPADSANLLPVDTLAVSDTASSISGDTIVAVGDTSTTATEDSLAVTSQTDTLVATGEPVDTTAAGQPATDTSQIASTEDTTTANANSETEDNIELTLVVNTPVPGVEVPAGSPLSVSGLTAPGATVTVRDVKVVADASGNFLLSLNAPSNAGNYNMIVTAELEGKNLTQEVAFKVPEEIKPLEVSVTAPTNGQELTEGVAVNMAGNVSDGATVVVNGQPALVNGNTWNAELTLSGEGEQSIKVDATRGDEAQSTEVLVNIVTKPIELSFGINRPEEGAEVKSSVIEVAGTGTPGAKVSVNGIVTAIPASGSWVLEVKAPESSGNYILSAEASLGDQTLSDEVNVVIPLEELKLIVTSPINGSEINTANINVSGTSTPGAQINVQGKTAQADASGNWSLTLVAPPEEGDYTLEVVAILASQELSADISFIRVIPRAPIVGSVQPLPVEVNEPKVVLSGKCNEGAIIEVGNFNTTVRSGSWTISASWPAENEGTQTFEVFCILNGEEEIIGEVSTEYVRPKIPLAFQLLTPSKVLQTSGRLDVRGSVQGQDISVEVNGKGVPVISGLFSHPVEFNESNWEDLDEVEVVVSDGEDEIIKLIEIEVDKTSPQINRNKPRFLSEPSIDAGFVRVRMADDIGDEVILSYQVDGTEEEDYTFEGSLSQSIPLIAGIHDYRIEAKDLAGNISVWERRGISHYPKVNLAIEVLNPRQNRTISLPPDVNVIDPSFEPSDDVAIRIRQLPDDDYNYLKEVRIENRANGASRIWKDIEIDDIEFEFDDLPLVLNRPNEIVIRVIPKEGQEKITTRTYVMQ